MRNTMRCENLPFWGSEVVRATSTTKSDGRKSITLCFGYFTTTLVPLIM